MFCKNCGKLIDDASKYCSFCGTKINVSVEHYKEEKNDDVQQLTQNVQQLESNNMVTIAETKQTRVADEIVANIRLIGIAFVLWICYIFGFIVYHHKDIKPMNENSWMGESRYDPTYLIGGVGEMNWKKIFAEKVRASIDYSQRPMSIDEIWASYEERNSMNAFETVMNLRKTPNEALAEAKSEAKSKKIPQQELEEMKEQSISEAQMNKEHFWSIIDSYRNEGFKCDLQNHMKWFAIVISLILIGCRYVIKFTIWVLDNKTS